MITADSLARLRALAAKTLTDSCTIEKEADATGAYGEPVHAWEIVASGVACRVLPAGDSTSSRAGTSGERENLEEMYQVALPYETEIGADYRITVGGVRYLVVYVEIAPTDAMWVEVIVTKDNG